MSRETPDRHGPQRKPSPIGLAVCAVALGGVYLALPWLMGGGASVSPWLLVAAAAVGAVGGWAVGTAASRPHDRTAARGRARSQTGFVVATAGAGLLLGRVLDVGAVPWVALICVALTMGAAAQVWVSQRRS